jgi:hypothetical protein
MHRMWTLLNVNCDGRGRKASAGGRKATAGGRKATAGGGRRRLGGGLRGRDEMVWGVGGAPFNLKIA